MTRRFLARANPVSTYCSETGIHCRWMQTLNDSGQIRTKYVNLRIVRSRQNVAITPGSRGKESRMAKKAPNPVDKHVGSRVRMRRMMLGMSQEKLGNALGLTFQQVQKYEKGTNRIGAGRLQQISQSLGVPVA